MFILSLNKASFTPIGLRNYSTTGIFEPKYLRTSKKQDYYFGAGTPDRSIYHKFAVRYSFDKGATLPKAAYLVSEFGSVKFGLDSKGLPNKIFFTQHASGTPRNPSEPLIFRADLKIINRTPALFNTEIFKVDSTSNKGTWEPFEKNLNLMKDASEMLLFHYNMFGSHVNRAYSGFAKNPPHQSN